MSLAQLPQQLKRTLKHEIKLEQLGFQKFKDLLLSMNENIKVELKGANHPFAYYVDRSPNKKDLDLNSISSKTLTSISSD